MLLPVRPDLLVTLTILLRVRSVSRAAAALGVSQPSVSRALAELRTALKDPLLVRSGNSMVLTRRAEDLADRLEEWLALTAAITAASDFHPSTIERRFRIASTDFGVMSVIRPALAAIEREAPGVTMDIVPLNGAIHSLLASGTLDLAITGLGNDPSRLHSELLFTDDFACLVRPDHPLTKEADGPLPLCRFLAFPHISLTVGSAEADRVTESLGPLAQRRIVASVPYFAIAPELIGSSDALMLLPSRAAKHYGRLHGLAHCRAPMEIGRLHYWLTWHERVHRDPASEWLRRRLLSTCPSPAE